MRPKTPAARWPWCQLCSPACTSQLAGCWDSAESTQRSKLTAPIKYARALTAAMTSKQFGWTGPGSWYTLNRRRLSRLRATGTSGPAQRGHGSPMGTGFCRDPHCGIGESQLGVRPHADGDVMWHATLWRNPGQIRRQPELRSLRHCTASQWPHWPGPGPIVRVAGRGQLHALTLPNMYVHTRHSSTVFQVASCSWGATPHLSSKNKIGWPARDLLDICLMQAKEVRALLILDLKLWTLTTWSTRREDGAAVL